ncbi:MAG: hypothetical protein ABIK07_03495, partial [Planctomycetota bacterium]
MERFWLLTSVIFLSLLQAPISARAEVGAPVSVKLRVEWGEQTARLWNARFALSGGQIKVARSLGVDADEAAVITQSDQKILYQPQTSRVFNSIEFQVEGDLSASLQVL